MSAPVSEVDAGLVGVLAAHRMEVEPRAYPAYACSCEKWDGAIYDNGGRDDGAADHPSGFAEHLAGAVQGYVEGRVAAAVEAERERLLTLVETDGAYNGAPDPGQMFYDECLNPWLRDLFTRSDARRSPQTASTPDGGREGVRGGER